MSPQIWRLRPLTDTIEAFQYSGEFPLSFLRPDETVRKASHGGAACIVEQGDNDVIVNLHAYVVRDLATGKLRADSADGWFRRYERTTEVVDGRPLSTPSFTPEAAPIGGSADR